MALELTQEEASKLLCLCMLSPGQLDFQAESALKKLAQFIRDRDRAMAAQSSNSHGANHPASG